MFLVLIEKVLDSFLRGDVADQANEGKTSRNPKRVNPRPVRLTSERFDPRDDLAGAFKLPSSLFQPFSAATGDVDMCAVGSESDCNHSS